MNRELLKLEVAAELLGMTRDQLYVQVREGAFSAVYVPSRRQWYVEAQSIADYL